MITWHYSECSTVRPRASGSSKSASRRAAAGWAGESSRKTGWKDTSSTAANVADFPLPTRFPLELGRELDGLAQRLSCVMTVSRLRHVRPDPGRTGRGPREHDHVRARMIALQEELDWQVYRLVRLADRTGSSRATCRLRQPFRTSELGERAFEIVLARQMAEGADRDAVVRATWFDADHRDSRALARGVPAGC